MAAWDGGDPLMRAKDALALAGVTAAEMEQDRMAAMTEMEDAYADAKSAPFPPASGAFTDVQDIGSPLQGAY